MGTQTYVRDIASLRIGDAEDAGGKGANLGELVAAGLPVPRGFVLMRAGYLDSMQAGGVGTELAALHREGLTRTADSERLDELCHRMRGLVTKAGVADVVRDQALAAYRRLGTDAKVAVRSSATGEDGRDASFAGMNKTITNVAGEDALIDAVGSYWASLFTPRVLTYRSSRRCLRSPPAPDQGHAFQSLLRYRTSAFADSHDRCRPY
jgi:pyruvate, water dikinase